MEIYIMMKIKYLLGIFFKSRSGRMLVFEVVHIQCSKLFKVLECAVLECSVHYKETLKSLDKSRA